MYDFYLVRTFSVQAVFELERLKHPLRVRRCFILSSPSPPSFVDSLLSW
jgi:hypothetical protein